MHEVIRTSISIFWEKNRLFGWEFRHSPLDDEIVEGELNATFCVLGTFLFSQRVPEFFLGTYLFFQSINKFGR